jgi:hypothetical protein
VNFFQLGWIELLVFVGLTMLVLLRSRLYFDLKVVRTLYYLDDMRVEILIKEIEFAEG